MADTAKTPAAPEPPNTAAEPPEPPNTAPAAGDEPPAGTPPAGSTEDWTMETLPPGVQKYIKDLRKEAGDHRTKAATTAQEAQDRLDAILEAAGLKDKPDPAAAAAENAKELDATKADLRTARVENAILKRASKHGADPEALTDSRQFMSKVTGLDPDADDFDDQVEEAITKAIEGDSRLKLAGGPALPKSGGAVGGKQEGPEQVTYEELKDMSNADRVKALKEGRLDGLMGGTPKAST